MMSTLLGCSSELYFIDPQDIISLEDASAKFLTNTKDEVAILIQQGAPDCLIKGRKTLSQAISSPRQSFLRSMMQLQLFTL